MERFPPAGYRCRLARERLSSKCPGGRPALLIVSAVMPRSSNDAPGPASLVDGSAPVHSVYDLRMYTLQYGTTLLWRLHAKGSRARSPVCQSWETRIQEAARSLFFFKGKTYHLGCLSFARAYLPPSCNMCDNLQSVRAHAPFSLCRPLHGQQDQMLRLLAPR